MSSTTRKLQLRDHRKLVADHFHLSNSQSKYFISIFKKFGGEKELIVEHLGYTLKLPRLGSDTRKKHKKSDLRPFSKKTTTTLIMLIMSLKEKDIEVLTVPESVNKPIK